VFFGWWTVLAGGLIALWGHGFHTYGFSALFKPLSEELGFGRAVTSVAASIGRFEGGFEAPITGWVTDRFGPRWIVITGVSLIAVGLITMRYIDSLWQFYLVWGVIVGTGTNIALSLPLDTAISNWFVKKRGLALSIKWVFSGLSGVLVLPLVSWLITQQDWRYAVLVGGIIMGAVGLPLAWFSLRSHRPEYYGLLPDGASAQDVQVDRDRMIALGVEYAAEISEVEFTLRQAMRTRVFWLSIAAQAFHSLVIPVMSIHCIPFLTDRGIDPVRAAAMMSIWVAASIPSRFVGGLIADRVRVRYLRFIIGGAYLIQAIGVAIYLQADTMASIYVWFVLYGLGQGLGMTTNPLMRARYFGRKSFGSIAGFSRLFMTPIGVLGPVYAGWIYDTTGSYSDAFVQFAVTLAISGVIALFLMPPKRPATITDVRSIV
jgi:sugar phosphate permease